MKLFGRLFILTALTLGGGGFASAQSGNVSGAVLTASIGSNLGAASNPSGFSFGSASSVGGQAPQPLPPIAANGVMGFQIWKQSQMDEAKLTLEKIQSGSSTGAKNPTADTGKNPKPIHVDQRLRQAQLNVQIAQELTVNDYFLIYLSQFKAKDAFTEAAKRLSPDEMAELLMSYQHYLSRADQIDAPASGLLTGYGGGVPASAAAPIHPVSRAPGATKTPRPL